MKLDSIKTKLVSSLLLTISVATLALAMGSEVSMHNRDEVAERSGDEFEISHYTIDGGYKTLVGGEFELRGIIGQPEAGISEGNESVFIGGFLHPDLPLNSSLLFMDGFES